MQISDYTQKSTQIYPFQSQTILANGIIQDFRVLISDVFKTVVIDQIQTKPDYLYISILAYTDNRNAWVKHYFQCKKAQQIIRSSLLCSSDPALQFCISCFILLSKLPDYTASFKPAQSNFYIKLRPQVISFTKGLNAQAHINFQGYINTQIAPDNYIKFQKSQSNDTSDNKIRIIAYRTVNPGYQLSSNQMTNFQSRLIKRVNKLAVSPDQLLQLVIKPGLQYAVSKDLDEHLITLYLYNNNDAKLGCDVL